MISFTVHAFMALAPVHDIGTLHDTDNYNIKSHFYLYMTPVAVQAIVICTCHQLLYLTPVALHENGSCA
jgi:hypothetical protein